MSNYGLIGNPVEQSLSPMLHSLLYQKTGYPGCYSRFPVEAHKLADVIPSLRVLGISGVNVTSPYKEAILPYVDILSPEAAAIGAVNTLKITQESVAGYNTDGIGFAESLLHAGIAIKGKSFVLCGTGGAGKAAHYALRQYGASEVIVASTDASKGISYNALAQLPPKDVIINCTPLGMGERLRQSPVDEKTLGHFSAAVDLIYNPMQTLFLKQAEQQGLITLNGLPMLVFQGIESFTLWTGLVPPKEAAQEILENLTCFLQKKTV